MDELISIIIPVYNVEGYIGRCMKSVLSQTYKNLEIILVDDGSTDRSGKLCDEYQKADSRVKVIHKKNGGLSSARNAGLRVAKGEMIGFLDSDDWIHCQMYEILHADMMEYKVDLVICSYCEADGEQIIQQHIMLESLCISGDKALGYVLDECLNHAVWNRLYRRELLEEYFFIEGRNYEDVVFTNHIMMGCGTVFYEKKVLYYYFKTRQDSISNTESFQNRMDYISSYYDALMEIKGRCPWHNAAGLKGLVISYLVLCKSCIGQECIEHDQLNIIKKFQKMVQLELEKDEKKIKFNIKEKIELWIAFKNPVFFVKICRIFRQ